MDAEEGIILKRRHQTAEIQPSRWKTAREHLTYSSKLLEALRYVSARSPKSPSLKGRLVREAADRVLAAAARGRTKWSRAVLSNKMQRKGRVLSSRYPRLDTRRFSTRGKRILGMDRKLKVLARLVPGGRKLSFSSLLEEASDYISALEMQVRAMNTLAKVLSSVGSPSVPSSSSSLLPEA